MLYTDQHIISQGSFVYDYCSLITSLSKNLRNAALFRVRQVFTGWDLPEDERAGLQRVVFNEVKRLQEASPSVKVRRNISYKHLDALLKLNENPDYRAGGLPAQSAQQVLKQVIRDWKSWLAAARAYKKHPEKFAGRPKMPGYCSSERITATITNQDAVLYPVYDNEQKYLGQELKLPLVKERLFLPHLSKNADLREVKIVPFYGKFILSLTIESHAPFCFTDMPNTAGIDFGISNTAAFVCNGEKPESVVYKGGALLAENQLFAKRRASAVSAITQGHGHLSASSRHLSRLSLHHALFTKDYLHKVSSDIIRRCVTNRVGIIVLGVNKGWKQRPGMGKRNNQNFVSVPIYKLREMIRHKALLAGIIVIEQEESYTSKADITAMDPIPVYGKEPEHLHFSGRRVKRGLYMTSQGYLINADCGAAANIMRKAFPDAWGGISDFRFLASPERVDFNALNKTHAA